MYFPSFPKLGFLPLPADRHRILSHPSLKSVHKTEARRKVTNEAVSGPLFRIKSCKSLQPKGQGQEREVCLEPLKLCLLYPRIHTHSSIGSDANYQKNQLAAHCLYFIDIRFTNIYLLVAVVACLFALSSVFKGDCGGNVLNQEM